MNRDKYIIGISKKVVKLRELENSQPLSRQHISLFDELLAELFKRKKFAKDQMLWEEMYSRSLVFYDSIKTIGNDKIPIVLVTKHNHIVNWYMRQLISEVGYTLWHFDCHSDMNPVKGNRELREMYQRYQKGESLDDNRIDQIVWDIGAAVSGTVIATGARDLVWCLPTWLPDREMELKYGLIGKNKKLVTNDSRAKRDATIDFEYMNKTYDAKTFSKVQTGKLTKNRLKRLEESIRKNGRHYILDIDLDYFVCNGKELDKHKYLKDPYDVSSYGRTKKKEFNQSIPRETLYGSVELNRYSSALQKETTEIANRIREFFKVIKYMKSRGLTPSHISVCDSTNVNFERCGGCNSVSNGYVPRNLALYVHTLIVNGLNEMF
jgi:hypothetical protein